MTGEGIQGALRSPARSQNITYVDVALLARHFGVSYAAAVWRLRGLNLLSAEQTEMLLDQTEEANSYLRAVRAYVDVEDSGDEMHLDHELDWQVLWLALEAWWRNEISQGRLLEVGRLLNIEDGTILDLAN